MAEGFIIRKGGAVTEQALAPTITEVSTTDTSITFTITNNDASTAVILYEVGDTTPDANSIELAASATSSNLTISGLTDNETYIVYATANVTGKIKSPVASASIDIPEVITYTAATGGTTLEYDSGGKRYKSHTFTSDGTFTVTTVGDATDDRNKVDYLIIAGGGAGGAFNRGGGGGAGGFRTTVGTQGGLGTLGSKVVVTAQAYSIDVGAGGAFTDSDPEANGDNSSALGVTATGGGAGGTGRVNGSNGGSGGGGGADNGGSADGGTGTANQGFDGGFAPTQAFATGRTAAGGGGAGEQGADGGSGSGDSTGKGGDGLANTLRDGTSETRGGGGGGSRTSAAGAGGGIGGGGTGSNTGTGGTSGTVNTGGGGGGQNSGGSGIVIIRYEIAPSV